MLNNIFNSLVRAWRLVLSRPQLQLVLVLLVIFPLLFTFILQQFLSVATNQVEYTLKQTISHDHDALTAFLNTNPTTEQIINIIRSYGREGGLINSLQVARDEGVNVVVVADISLVAVGTTVVDDSFYKSAIAHGDSSVIYPYLRNGERIWRAYRAININGVQWYVHSEISLAGIDAKLEQQAAQADMGLLLVFVFLGLLTWWFWRQYDYKEAWLASEEKLQQQFGFTNMMVHELRAPLTAIRGYASLITEAQSLPADQQPFIDNISSSANRLVRLVNDFLEVSRIQAGTLSVSLVEVDIRDTIVGVVQEMTASAEEKRLKITSTLPSGQVVIATDTARLHQIVTNLLSNAIKYTKEGGISVVLNQTPLGVEIRIQDSGHGIKAKDQAQLFQPFKRVGNADAGGEVGSGLGMWITKQLVALLGGEVSIESIENVGTHAVVRLYNKRKKK